MNESSQYNRAATSMLYLKCACHLPPPVFACLHIMVFLGDLKRTLSADVFTQVKLVHERGSPWMLLFNASLHLCFVLHIHISVVKALHLDFFIYCSHNKLCSSYLLWKQCLVYTKKDAMKKRNGCTLLQWKLWQHLHFLYKLQLLPSYCTSGIASE